jgi:dCMP deaminase
MKLAKLVSERSKCLSRKIGAVLVKNNHIIATGYNGPPKDVPHCDHRDNQGNYTKRLVSKECPRRRMEFGSGQGMEHCVAVHAEINPILQAAKFGVSTEDSTLYCFCGTPCTNCTKEIINAGIKRVVCTGKDGDIKNEYNFSLAEKLFELAEVKLDVIKGEGL